MTNSFALLSPRYIFDPFFTRHKSSKHCDTKIEFYRHTYQEKINFVRDLSLSQQHTVVRSWNRCFLPCFAMDINGHLNGLIVETMNSKLKLTSNKYHAMHHFNLLQSTHDVVTLPDEAERWWFLTVSMGDVTLATRRRKVYILFQTIGAVYSGRSCVNNRLSLIYFP